MTTGPLHWELLQRARAVDNQIYVATCSPARLTGNSDSDSDSEKDDFELKVKCDYVPYGHSMVVSPVKIIN